jgi:hypothetical protein
MATPAVDVTGIDLLSPEWELFRATLTRTLKIVRPDLYATYRKIKDGDSAEAREEAYAYVFSVLRTIVDQRDGSNAD